ncbi:hypothetical protein OEZ85_003940 [Tetradesmus obliquus]|uniref:Uncharacterized protein n=1 Tax=Tetradesmus obliquus TaxID=3088 RepID=A0ABY8UG61_TETOB|nr:hypothetical protein OEZ85_003940 [Tetradesmus obliquus]
MARQCCQGTYTGFIQGAASCSSVDKHSFCCWMDVDEAPTHELACPRPSLSDDASSGLHQQQAAEASCGAAAVASKPKRKRGRPQKKQQQAEQADEEPEELEEQAAAVAAATVLLANLDGDYTEEENLRFADMAKGSTKDSTNNLYAPHQKLYNDFCESHGIAAQVTSKKDIPKLTRWYELFCEGKALHRDRRPPGAQRCPRSCSSPSSSGLSRHQALLELVYILQRLRASSVCTEDAALPTLLSASQCAIQCVNSSMHVAAAPGVFQTDHDSARRHVKVVKGRNALEARAHCHKNRWSNGAEHSGS